MIISFIAALSSNQVIGRNNDLPWSLPDDMKFFMETTTGHTVIMGRKNYESLPAKYRPLPNRTNIVITRQQNFQAAGCTVVHSVEEALDRARSLSIEEVFVIGGAEIFQAAFQYAQRLYLTEINSVVEGNVYFPAWNKSNWKEISRRHHPADSRHSFSFDFTVYERKE